MSKIKVHEPKTIEEAINDLQTFLDSDLWSKFKDEKIKGKVYVRKDKFEKEKDLSEYLDCHFNILKKQIKNLKEKFINNGGNKIS